MKKTNFRTSDPFICRKFQCIQQEERIAFFHKREKSKPVCGLNISRDLNTSMTSNLIRLTTRMNSSRFKHRGHPQAHASITKLLGLPQKGPHCHKPHLDKKKTVAVIAPNTPSCPGYEIRLA